MLQHEIEDIPVLEQWLSARKGSRVYIRVPKKGNEGKAGGACGDQREAGPLKGPGAHQEGGGRTIGAVKEICALLSIPEANRMEGLRYLQHQRL